MTSLEQRIRHLQQEFDDFRENLKFAWDYVRSDAPSSLTKSRLIMETLLLQLYQAEMGREPKKPLLGDMLGDNQFTRKIGRRILVRMNTIRDMGNLGAHGITVAPDDATRILEDLCTVLEWYLARYASGAATPSTEVSSRPQAISGPAAGRSAGAHASTPVAREQNDSAAAACASVRAILSFVTAAGEEATITIDPGEAVVAGRLAGLALVFDHPTVSKRHAEFRLGGEGLAVCDLESKNHVFVNGEPVTWVLLNRGDTVRLSKSGPAIRIIEAPIVWPQTVSDMARVKPSSAAAPSVDAPQAPATADATEVDQPINPGATPSFSKRP